MKPSTSTRLSSAHNLYLSLIGVAQIIADSTLLAGCVLAYVQILDPSLLSSDQQAEPVIWITSNTALIFVTLRLMLYSRWQQPLALAFICPTLLALVLYNILWLRLYWDQSVLSSTGFVWANRLMSGGAYILIIYWVFLQHSLAETLTSRLTLFGEWFVWLFCPRLAFLLAIALHVAVAPIQPWTLALLLSVASMREVLTMHHERWRLGQLHQAQQQAQVNVQQTELFLKKIVHDLGSPLHGLKSTLRRLSGPASVYELAELQLDHLQRMHTQLRDYQRACFRPNQIKLVATNLIASCAAAFDSVQDQADYNHVALILDLDPWATHVQADPVALRRALDNLLSNALHATPPGGTICLSTRASCSKTVTISVSDTGSGIPETEQQRIFEPFVHLNSSGMGLGLTIVAEQIQAMSGTITLHSVVGQGSIFTITLPQAEHSEGA